MNPLLKIIGGICSSRDSAINEFEIILGTESHNDCQTPCLVVFSEWRAEISTPHLDDHNGEDIDGGWDCHGMMVWKLWTWLGLSVIYLFIENMIKKVEANQNSGLVMAHNQGVCVDQLYGSTMQAGWRWFDILGRWARLMGLFWYVGKQVDKINEK